MNNKGYVFIWRKLMDKGYYKKSEYTHLWVHLIMKANHADTKIFWNGKEVVLKRGQFITGRRILSEETGIKETTIERILKVFENEQQIGQQKTNLFRLITINNYNSMQKVDSKTDNQWTTNGQPMDTDKNDNNEKNDNKKDIKQNTLCDFETFWKAYPNKKGRAACEKKWKILKPDARLVKKILLAIAEQNKWREDAKPGEFRPEWKNPLTWLNQGCWEDEIVNPIPDTRNPQKAPPMTEEEKKTYE